MSPDQIWQVVIVAAIAFVGSFLGARITIAKLEVRVDTHDDELDRVHNRLTQHETKLDAHGLQLARQEGTIDSHSMQLAVIDRSNQR